MIDMHRLPDWDARLATYLRPLRKVPFAYGSHDCCMFCAGAVEAMTGVDPMSEFRGRYRSAAGASRALRTIGAGTLAETIDTKLDRCPPAHAQRGDVVMADGMLGICWGSFMFAVGREIEGEAARDGLIRIERAAWVDPLAWRVPY